MTSEHIILYNEEDIIYYNYWLLKMPFDQVIKTALTHVSSSAWEYQIECLSLSNTFMHFHQNRARLITLCKFGKAFTCGITVPLLHKQLHLKEEVETKSETGVGRIESLWV